MTLGQTEEKLFWLYRILRFDQLNFCGIGMTKQVFKGWSRCNERLGPEEFGKFVGVFGAKSHSSYLIVFLVLLQCLFYHTCRALENQVSIPVQKKLQQIESECKLLGSCLPETIRIFDAVAALFGEDIDCLYQCYDVSIKMEQAEDVLNSCAMCIVEV